MSKILSKLFSLLKYVLLILAFAITLFGIINTYKRLEKPIMDALPVFIPFLLVFVLFIVNIFVKKAKIGENLLFNFTAIVLFIIIIIVGVRAKFDTNMLLYHKYKIDYNPLYFADNLSSIKIMLYCLALSNFFLILKSYFEEPELKAIEKPELVVNNSVKLEEQKPIIEEKKEENVEITQKIEPIQESVKPVAEVKPEVEEL